MDQPLLSPAQPPTIPATYQSVFQTMAARKLERTLRGTYKENKPWTILWTFLILLLIFGLVAPNFTNQDGSGRTIDVKVDIRDLGFFSLMGVIVAVFLVYTLTRVVVVVRWSLYWLLLTVVILYFWKRQFNIFSRDTPLIIIVGFSTAEFLTFAIFVASNYLYPPLLASSFFLNTIGVSWWWRLRPVPNQPWTFTYQGDPLEGRRTCTYRGETDSQSLPHGFGHWLDDSFHGELLSGLWEHGIPVGPFRSREFGSGYAFENLRVGFAHCSDDDFFSRSHFPSQTKPPTFGVASVECSVAGGFFSHLPRARIRVGPFADPHRLAQILPDIKVLYTEHPSSSLILTATRGGGVAVSGHSYPSGQSPPRRLVIDVVEPSSSSALVPSDATNSLVLPEDSESPSQHTDFVPLFDESLVTSASSTLTHQLLQQQQALFSPPHPHSALPPLSSTPLAGPFLRVRDWRSTVEGHVEALVFFPGFNASLKHACQRLGQFMAMGRFPPHIKPFVFSTPAARELTYLWAVASCQSEATQQALHAFLTGLREAGITDVHFLVHSLGAQTVTAALRDRLDGSLAPVAALFATAPPFASSSTHQDSRRLRLRTVSFLNPDIALSDFVKQDFACIRRVCATITVVGDRKDGALDFSELCNGIVCTLQAVRRTMAAGGWLSSSNHPLSQCFRLFVNGSCRSRRHAQDKPFARVLTVGRNIFSLYAQRVEGDVEAHPRDSSRPPQRRAWLDLDAIDTSSMDANVHKIRHSYFDLNKLLVDDLNELICTGKRAVDRSLLLHREGNIFSFCQAPSCVVNP